MTEEKDKRKFMVGGYEFTSKEDAQIAKDELNAIKYVSSKTNSKDPKQVYRLYNKIIERKLFSTQIGMNYLKSLQTFLYKSSEIPNDKIQPIPINTDTQDEINIRRERSEFKSELRDLSIKVARYKNNFTRVMIINVILVIIIVAMFIILNTSSNPNIINYEVNLQNKYAQWQEQLQSQEQSLNARENELNNRK
jgi:uncharacterized integral membrane protein